MEDTSLEAFRELQRSGLLNIRYLQVIEAVKGSPGCTQSEACKAIFAKLGPSSRITNRSFTPRFAPLVRAEVFVEKAKRRCTCTGKRVKTYEYTGKKPDLQKLKHSLKGLRGEFMAQQKALLRYQRIFEPGFADDDEKQVTLNLEDDIDKEKCMATVKKYLASHGKKEDWIKLLRTGFALVDS